MSAAICLTPFSFSEFGSQAKEKNQRGREGKRTIAPWRCAMKQTIGSNSNICVSNLPIIIHKEARSKLFSRGHRPTGRETGN